MRPPPGRRPPFEPQGRALQDWLDGVHEAAVQVHCEDGESESVAAATFFRGPEAFEDWERAALDACVGRVLDLGAGAGCHALALQDRGHAVLALDTDPRSVGVMARRGVREARAGSLGRVAPDSVDTLLLLQHGSGLAGDLGGLRRLLAEARRAVGPGGRVVLDGRGPDHVDREELATCREADYPGVAELWMSYGDCVGSTFPWLFVDLARFTVLAAEAGWRVEPGPPAADGRWLAVLESAT